MKIRRLTEITTETREVLFFRRRGNADGWCDQCGARVKMVSPEEAAAEMGLTLRQIFRQIEVGTCHFQETDEGLILICFNSLVITETLDAGGNKGRLGLVTRKRKN